MRSLRLSHQNSEGVRLAGRLDLPDAGRPLACALFAHCFTCTKNLKAVGHIARALTRAGLGVLRFDFTGLGESEGDFADTSFSSNVEDLVEMAGVLAREHELPRILIGHSLGGAAVIQAAARIESVRAVATIGAPFEPAHVAKLLEGSRETIEREGKALVRLAGRPFTIKKQFLDDLESSRPEQALANLGRALLVMHSPVDAIVGIDNAARIFQAARHPKSFVSLDRADHLLSDEADALYAGSVLAAWARKYVTTEAEEPARAEREAAGVVVSLDTEDGFRSEVQAAGHALVADEPRRLGGTDEGPSPYDLLLAGLGACTAMTLRLYAERKRWPLERSVVRLRHDRIHAEDCADCETKSGQVDRIQRQLELVGPLDAEQRQRLLEIAEKCPVHRTLSSEIRIETALAAG